MENDLNNQINVRIVHKNDTYENWTKNNPVLLNSEIGYDSTNKKIKIGDGITEWNLLPYYAGKADTATTLEGYGITDAYTKQEVNTLTDEIYEELDSSKASKSETEEIWKELEFYYYELGDIDERKPDRTRIVPIEIEDISDDEGNTAFLHYMVQHTNTEIRLPELNILSIEFEDAEYNWQYMSSLSFDSGATPTSIDYTNSGILNWVGTDCSMTNDGLSIFQPSANTHYDIVFYFNGRQFIGLVNGYVSSIEWQGELPTGNEAV